MAPSFKIPPGPTPVVNNGQVAINAVLLVLGPIFVALRFWARKIKRQPWLGDDYTILAALIINTGLCIHGLWAGSEHYIGYVIPFMKAHARIEYKKSIYVDVILCHLVYGIIKMSVVLFYRRIFQVRKRFRVFFNIYFTVVVAWTITAFFGSLFCAGRKPSDFWTGPPTQLSRVINYGAFLLSMNAIDLTLDIIVLLIPLPLIRSMTLSTRRKAQVIGVFALGAFCLVASAVRVYYAYQVTYITSLSPFARTRMSNLNHIWGHLEATFSIIAACLPTIVPVFTQLRSAESLVSSLQRLYLKSISALSLTRSGKKGNSDGSRSSGEEQAMGNSQPDFVDHESRKVMKKVGSRETEGSLKEWDRMEFGKVAGVGKQG
ncbi:hypothetical protein CC80DRAFT_248826 [Byssothecium circinans]|uniref:Rhodopsin domain-containing protein n=1 Tax=Byssothecium circinans TaxID=147558 RepID=A0A6A5TBF9_9PLEO|nr:hypothetical protein CC80DRAFT_248826 [Byssothecium circinans]